MFFVRCFAYKAIFLFAWTPYALVAFYSALIEPNGVGPFYSLLPAVFAKSSVLWSSLFYLCTNYIFRRPKKAANTTPQYSGGNDDDTSNDRTRVTTAENSNTFELFANNNNTSHLRSSNVQLIPILK